MDLAFAFTLFISSVIFVLYYDYSMSLAMSAGFVIFICAGLHRKFTLKSLIIMSISGAKDSLIVIRVLLTIGILTGLWRSAGTFALLTAWGLQSITPSMFVLSAFILSCILSYALGTSFGTAGTLGVALMTLSRSGGVDPVITAGAIMSGIHFGDRGSPSSSCANLVSALTGTDIYSNVKAMMKTAIIPLILSSAFYIFLSVNNPLISSSNETLNELSSAFNLNPIAIIPAVLMLVMPLLRVNIFIAFLSSIFAAFICTVFIQDYSIIEAVRFAVLGLHYDSGIRAVFSGGGLVSMISSCYILIVTGTYGGIFEGTGMLAGLHEKISNMIKRFGEYPVILVIGTLMNAVFCNQTVGVIMTARLMKALYHDNNALALDISNSTVITAPLVPCCMACYVPLSMLQEDIGCLWYACYLYLIPLCYFRAKRNLPDK